MRQSDSLSVEWFPTERLRSLPGHALPERVVRAAVALLAPFGWRRALVADPTGLILFGDVMRQAALRLGIADVPVHVVRDLAGPEALAYRQAELAAAHCPRCGGSLANG